MAKFSGVIGFATQTQTKPGVWKDEIKERKYRGDIIRDTNRYQSANQANDNLTIDNQISIVSDSYANENFGYMKYINYKGIKWKIKSVELKYPRLIISFGDIYNG